ncbi:hypothetical protein FRC06_009110 [Ceratobasidium sp. 370]|nr:hypothetical protein FRC06_009110 [Ceratobasidium sp. 370]
MYALRALLGPSRPGFALVRTLATWPGLVLRQHPTALHLSGPSLPHAGLTLPFDWLRDSCQCARCVHPSTKQKLVRTGGFVRPVPRAAAIANQGSAVRVEWGGEGHDSVYAIDFLKRYADPSGQARHASHYDDVLARRAWDVAGLPPGRFIDYESFKADPLVGFLQLLRYGILVNRVEGGTSVFVDAIKAANDLWDQDQEAFNLLAETPIPFHYENDGHHLHRSHPTIQLVPSHVQPHTRHPFDPPQIAHINYSPPFQAPLPATAPPKLYAALRTYTQLLARPAGRFEHTLAEGECAVFDNRRVLHARTAFWDKGAHDEGQREKTNRWLKGCYVEVDDLLDRTRVLLARRSSDLP